LRSYIPISWNILKKWTNLDTYDCLKLNQGDISQLKRSVAHSEIEAEVVYQKRKVQDLMDSPLNFTRPLKKN
jgi:hypothetical protein